MTMTTAENTMAVIAGVSALAALLTLGYGVAEYRRQGITRRSELFLRMRSRLREDAAFKNICDLLETDSEELRDVAIVEKDRFLGFFEELALLKNSGLVNDQVSAYMFGYFAVRCLHSENFWHDLNREHNLWGAFFDFARQMDKYHEYFEYKRDQFHL